MGSLNFSCPPASALAAAAKVTCPEKFGQIQRLGIRRKQDKAAANPTFTAAADVIDQSKWVAALAATDNKKIVLTPFISAFVIPQGTAISEEGGNNNTVNGIAILSGVGQVQCTGRFINLPEVIAAVLRSYTADSALTPGFTNLEIFPINEFGKILYKLDTDGVTPIGFEMFNWFVGTPGSEGLNKPNITPMQLELASYWSRGLSIADPSTAATAWDPRSL